MDRQTKGWVYGLIGVAIFSASLPATRVAVADFDPVFLTLARASIAGVVALCVLLIRRQQRPDREDLGSLVIVSIGVVVGFPLLTALALQHITSAHSIVFIGLLPLSTALFGVLRAGDRPSLSFWIFAVLGSTLVAGFALTQDFSMSATGDILMFAAIAVCGLGYAEGGKLSRKLGGWQVICWALVLSLPIMATLSFVYAPGTWADIGTPTWWSLAYVSLFSMLIGFVFWYHGLATGGVATVGQLQLLQPFMGLALAAFLLGEQISLPMIIVSLAVVACVVGVRRSSADQRASGERSEGEPHPTNTA